LKKAGKVKENNCDGIVVGGGIVGTAVAMTLSKRTYARIILIEAEKELAQHQTGRNSGVIHSGLYYRPGSLKAATCVRGREALYSFCAEHGIKHERCGKLVVATSEEELSALRELARRGEANGLSGLRVLRAEEIRAYEPEASGVAALLVPQTGIVDFTEVARAYAAEAERSGARIVTGAEFLGMKNRDGEFVVETTSGNFNCRFIVNTAGLYSDRIARRCGLRPRVRIIPFRGEYYELVPQRRFLVRNLIYPVPDPRFPFLGVHFTRQVNGKVEAGPNAVLALKRTGYGRFSCSLRDALEIFSYPGFWKLAGRYLPTGLAEFHRSLSKRAFTSALKRLVPAVREEDLLPAPSGVRAQAVDTTGALVDDFCILEVPGQIHVLNAPSPAATASLAIADVIAERVIKGVGLKVR